MSDPARQSMTVLTVEAVVSFLQVRVLHLRAGPNAQPQARVHVARSALCCAEFDWHVDVELLSVDGGSPTLLLRGTVFSAHEVDEHTVELDIRSAPDILDDIGTPGILIQEAPRADVAWSVVMTSGFDASSLFVEGKDELPVETFKIVAPIEGVGIVDAIDVDGVRLIQPTGSPPFDVPPEFGYLAEPFRTCGGLAIVEVSAQTLFEAEQTGLEKIDYALGAVLLIQRAAFIGPNSPSPLNYSRSRALSILSRHSVVAVLGEWGRRWLRGTRNARPAHVKPPTLAIDPISLPAFGAVSASLKEAIAAWQRAVNEVNRVAKLIALWECFEFYAAGTRLPRLFEEPGIGELRDRAIAGLSSAQAQRVDDLIKLLNSPSLMTKLIAAADRDGVVLSESELAMLRRLRRARNDISHGHTRTIPEHADLRKGSALAGRLLLGCLTVSTLVIADGGEEQDERANRERSTTEDSADGPTTSDVITEEEKQYALKAAKATALMMPYLERGTLVPGSVRSEIQALYADATEEVLVVGMMRACDVALKHLANHFLGDSFTDAALEAGSMIDRMRSDDIAGLGARAYDDGVRAAQLMADAMISRGTLDLLEELETSQRVLFSFNAVLFALLFILADRYEIAPSAAANQLGREISTITYRSV